MPITRYSKRNIQLIENYTLINTTESKVFAKLTFEQTNFQAILLHSA